MPRLGYSMRHHRRKSARVSISLVPINKGKGKTMRLWLMGLCVGWTFLGCIHGEGEETRDFQGRTNSVTASRPVHEVKPMAQWIEHLESDDPQVRDEAVALLARMGPSAIPGLIAALEHDDSYVRYVAVYALRDLGVQARSATNSLSERLYHDDRAVIRRGAAEALAHIGGDAEQVLCQALQCDDHEVCVATADALGKLQQPTQSVVASLAETLHTRDARICQAVANALAEMGSSAVAAIPALAEASRRADLETSARVEAIRALGKIGPETIPPLVQMLQSENLSLAAAACHALGTLGSAAEPAVPALRNMIHRPEAVLRLAAVESLGEIGSPAKGAVPDLIGLLHDKDRPLRFAAAQALGRMGPPAIRSLENALRDKDGTVRDLAAYALGEMGPDASAARTALSDALADEHDAVRRRAEWALERIGTPRSPNPATR